MTTVHKLVQTSSNSFHHSVISDSLNVTIAKPIEVNNSDTLSEISEGS